MRSSCTDTEGIERVERHAVQHADSVSWEIVGLGSRTAGAAEAVRVRRRTDASVHAAGGVSAVCVARDASAAADDTTSYLTTAAPRPQSHPAARTTRPGQTACPRNPNTRCIEAYRRRYYHYSHSLAAAVPVQTHIPLAPPHRNRHPTSHRARYGPLPRQKLPEKSPPGPR